MSNNPVFTCLGTKKVGRNRRREAEDIAKIMKYDADVLNAIKSATTEAELNRALATGRNRMR
jgi:hypothetical protein